jgi:hypothetical protein
VYPNSNPHTLDIINYSYGNINSYLHLGTLSGVGTGGFNWIYGANDILMSLTYDGRLGLGIINSTNTLHVVGTSTVTDSAYFGSNLYVASNLYVNGTLNLSTLTANVTGKLTGNVNATSGISTFNEISANRSNIQYLGIGGSAVSYLLEIGSGTDKIITDGTALGISTTIILPDIGLDASNVVAVVRGIGIGTTSPQSYADFSNAGAGSTDNPGFELRFMIPPKVSSTDRVGLSTVEGGLIYNTTSKSVENYNGTKWNNLTNPFTETTNLNNINAGIVTATDIRVGTGVTINGTAGIVTSINGFSSGIGTAVKITTVGNRLTFTVVGVGSTSLTLF